MKRLAILAVFVFIFTMILAPVMAQAGAPAPKAAVKADTKAPAPKAAVKADAKDPIRLGAIWDYAGPCYMLSESAVQGIKIAVDEINAQNRTRRWLGFIGTLRQGKWLSKLKTKY